MDGVVKRTSTKTCTHLGREPLEGDQCALVVDVGGEVVHARDLAQALSGGLLVQEDLFRVGYGVLLVEWWRLSRCGGETRHHIHTIDTC